MTLPDGRRLGWRRYGAGPVIVYLHGFVGSRLEPEAVALPDAGLIAVERPGYGLSDPAPALGVLGFAQDLLAALTALGIERFALAGMSAGAPFAMAVAHLAPTRVARLALVCGLADPVTIGAAGGKARLIQRFPAAAARSWATAGLVRRLLLLPGAGPALIAAVTRRTGRHLAGGERASVRAKLLASARAGLAGGTAGPLYDLAALMAPWGFAAGEVLVPTRIWHGRADDVVPAAHPAFYARRLPRLDGLHLVEGDHIGAAVLAGPAILAWLTDAADGAPLPLVA